MPTKTKQPLQSLPQLPLTPRWAPSTPRAVRALQQRSGGRRRSTNVNRPDSARNILRRLARITAPSTKHRPSTPQIKLSTPTGKENAHSPFISQDDEDLEDGGNLEKPDFTLPIEEADEDEDAGIAPTRQELPGGDDYTFKSIDFAARHAHQSTSARSDRIRRPSRMSILQFPEDNGGEDSDEDGDITAQSVEFGRRAMSEGPAWDRYPRSSFGSIRMSEFGLEEGGTEQLMEDEKSLIVADEQSPDIIPAFANNLEIDESGETENLGRFRQSLSEPVDDGLFIPDTGFQDDNDSFRLDFHPDDPTTNPQDSDVETQEGHPALPTISAPPKPTTPPVPSPQSTTRAMTEIEETALRRVPRCKRLKLTRKGNTIPALPSSLVKRVAIDSMTRIGKKRPIFNHESLVALEQATEWFFEQVGEDLGVYSEHAKRKSKIDDADVVTLMKRQRALRKGQNLEELAQEFLPDEVFLDIKLPDVG